MSIFTEPVITSTIGISKEFNLSTSDIEQRRKSFVDEKTLRYCGVRRISDDVGHQVLGIDTRQKGVDYDGLLTPYFDIFNDNHLTEFEIRRDKPDQKKNGAGETKEFKKYIKPRTTRNLLYTPPTVKAEPLKAKGKKIIVFTEGAFKAMALERAATNNFTTEDRAFFAVAISGVDNYKTKQTETLETGEKIKISAGLPEFENFNWKGAIVIRCFDSDADEKPNVKSAGYRFNRFFREKKIKVFSLDFPKEFEGIPTKGIDDFLGAIETKHDTETAIEVLHQLIDEAQKPKKLKSPRSDNFQLIEDGEGEKPGVYFTDETGQSHWICSPLKIVAETQTKKGENYGRLLEWRDSQNRPHRWAMPIEMVHSQGAELAKYLASQGLLINPSRWHYDKLAFYINNVVPDTIIISTDRTGWHNEECFVLPDQTFGSGENEITYQTEYEGHHNFRVSGTLEDWQKNISNYCSNNSRLLFAVSSAFAAPLLWIVQTQGGGFHFRGSTSTGKTTALLASGSVWGGDREHGFPQTWKATANGLEIIAAGHNHALLPLDEIGECEAREVGNVAYMLANGRGKLRMTKTLQSRLALTWNLIFLSTGEQSLSDKIAEVGGTVKGGQDIRLCDIDADTGKFGLFEDLRGFPSGQAFSDHLRAASCEYYGTPIREYLTWLTETDTNDIREQWHSFKDNFINDVLPNKAQTPSEVFRVAARFALVALGGELATTAGITKWSGKEAYNAAKAIFYQWLSGREGKGQTDAENAVRQVRAFLEKHGASAFQNVLSPEEKIINRAGFVKRNETSDDTEYLILPEAFRRDVCKGLDYRFVAKTLNERGLLEAQDTKTLSKNCYLSKELGKHRVYVIRNMLTESADDEKTAKAANL